MENTNEIVKVEENQSSPLMINTKSQVYCSFKPKSMEDRKKLFNSLENCDVVLNDIVGQKIKVKDVYIQSYPRTDKETGEKISDGHRTILFDENGKTYVTASNYFFVSIVKLFNSINTPDTWESALDIQIVKRDLKNGNKALGFKLV